MKKVKRPIPKKAPIPVATVPNDREFDPEDSQTQFQVELYWCIQQLQNSLLSGKLTEKQADEAQKNTRILKSSTAQLVKKRQLMKSLFGDYRSKMKDEEKKMGLASKSVKFTQPATSNCSSFVKKSAILTSGKDFKFNFDTNGLTESTEPTSEETSKPKEDQKFVPSEGPFKFNFQVEESNENLNFQSLAI
ncbi:hypothetical protein ACFFRR_002615 [Megaselia abdita]